MHCDQFWQLSKTCHFSTIRCFLKKSFAQNNSNMVLESLFTCFLEFKFLTQIEHFAKAIAHAL